MTRRLVGLALAASLLFPATVLARDPSGSFTLTPASPYVEGQSVTVTVETTGVNRNYEVTLAIDCHQPDGTEMLIGNHGNIHLFELSSIRGPWVAPQTFTLWTTGTGYTCRARLAAILWKGGYPVAAWSLDEETFAVTP